MVNIWSSVTREVSQLDTYIHTHIRKPITVSSKIDFFSHYDVSIFVKLLVC